MLIRYNNEDDLILLCQILKDNGYEHVRYYKGDRYEYHFGTVYFKHNKIKHELNIYIKKAYSNGEMFIFVVGKDGIEFNIDVVNEYVSKKVTKQNKQQINKNVATVNKNFFKMYLCGKLEELGGEITLNADNNVSATFRIPYAVKIHANTSVRKNPELDFDLRKIRVVSKAAKFDFETTLGNFINNISNLASLQPEKENTNA